jgi:hypothetical protein
MTAAAFLNPAAILLLVACTAVYSAERQSTGKSQRPDFSLDRQAVFSYICFLLFKRSNVNNQTLE